MLELAESLRAAEEREARAMRRRDEAQLALEAAVQTERSAARRAEEAEARAAEVESQLEEAESRLEEAELRATEWQGAHLDMEGALAREVEAGSLYHASDKGKRELVKSQRGVHKRGVVMGMRQAVERYRHLHIDIQPFTPDYFPKVNESSRGTGGPADPSAPRGSGSGEVASSARRGET